MSQEMDDDQVRDILGMLSEFAGRPLRDPDRFGELLRHGRAAGKATEVGELAFAGNYLTRLVGTMRKQTADSDHYRKLEAEFSRAVHEFHALVRDFVSDGNDALRETVERHYLAVSETSLKHLVALAHDFAVLKDWELAMTDDTKE